MKIRNKKLIKFLLLMAISPLILSIVKTVRLFKKVKAIVKAKFLCWFYGSTYYVMVYDSGRKFMVLSDMQEGILRKKMKIKKLTFSQLQKGVIFTARGKRL